MTEAEWQVSDDASSMVEFVGSPLHGRKSRLVACACCRLDWHKLLHETRRAVQLAEDFLHHNANGDDLSAARDANWSLYWTAISQIESNVNPPAGSITLDDDQLVACCLAHIAANPNFSGVEPRSSEAIASGDKGSLLPPVLHPGRAGIVRDLFGSLPFRKILMHPSYLAFRDHTPVRLAQAIYAQRNLDGTLDNARLAILADALEEAGCNNHELLAHLRQPTRHWLGCFAVDLILGKS